MPHLGPGDWALLLAAAVMVGVAKTAITGTGALAAALFALALPARESTGALLPLLIAGDLVAIALYRRHASWPVIRRLFPWVAVGIVVGAVFVAHVDDTGMRRAIGGLLIVLVAVQVVVRRAGLGDLRRGAWSGSAAAVAGLLAGFATMVANASGAVMTVYLLLSGMAMMEFIGTGAVFYLMVNIFKLPFSIALGLLGGGAVALDLALLPVMLAGAGLGVLLLRRLEQKRFEQVAIGLVVASAIPLLI